MDRIIFITLGTVGDVLPYFQIAEELSKKLSLDVDFYGPAHESVLLYANSSTNKNIRYIPLFDSKDFELPPSFNSKSTMNKLKYFDSLFRKWIIDIRNTLSQRNTMDSKFYFMNSIAFYFGGYFLKLNSSQQEIVVIDQYVLADKETERFYPNSINLFPSFLRNKYSHMIFNRLIPFVISKGYKKEYQMLEDFSIKIEDCTRIYLLEESLLAPAKLNSNLYILNRINSSLSTNVEKSLETFLNNEGTKIGWAYGSMKYFSSIEAEISYLTKLQSLLQRDNIFLVYIRTSEKELTFNEYDNIYITDGYINLNQVGRNLDGFISHGGASTLGIIDTLGIPHTGIYFLTEQYSNIKASKNHIKEIASHKQAQDNPEIFVKLCNELKKYDKGSAAKSLSPKEVAEFIQEEILGR